jgi:hypothetical protein
MAMQLLQTWAHNKKGNSNKWNEAKDHALKQFLEKTHGKFKMRTRRDIMKSTNFKQKTTSKRYREHTAIMADEINTMINKRKRKLAENQD